MHERFTGTRIQNPHDQERRMNIVLVGSAGVAGSAWSQAVSVVETDPDVAETRLVEAQIRLHHFARSEVRDALRLVNRALQLLDAELGERDEDD